MTIFHLVFIYLGFLGLHIIVLLTGHTQFYDPNRHHGGDESASNLLHTLMEVSSEVRLYIMTYLPEITQIKYPSQNSRPERYLSQYTLY